VIRHILLDSTPLGVLTKPTHSTVVVLIARWIRACLAAGHHIYVPEVIDYELRRELLRAGKSTSVSLLDGLKAQLYYLPITTDAMLRAADLWAQSRRSGQPTGNPLKLDIDVILAAQALTLRVPTDDEILVATENIGHLSRFVAAAKWNDIAPRP
jgi:predicted nucleic acid-binding protein